MKQFAVGQGYEPGTVRKVVGRYAGSNRRPRGVLAREILQKLGETIRSAETEERIHHGDTEVTEKRIRGLRA